MRKHSYSQEEVCYIFLTKVFVADWTLDEWLNVTLCDSWATDAEGIQTHSNSGEDNVYDPTLLLIYAAFCWPLEAEVTVRLIRSFERQATSYLYLLPVFILR